ncbi:MAG: recombination regulator RecX, partial [Clostridia bacterium]|nr:recombination regulator RecX [Clostridia bacterium]
MSIITEISPQKKDKKRVNIYLDGEYYCGLSLETVYAYSLKKGKDLSPEELAEIQLKSEKSEALDKAMGYVSRAMKTKKQVKDYLAGKGYTAEVTAY